MEMTVILQKGIWRPRIKSDVVLLRSGIFKHLFQTSSNFFHQKRCWVKTKRNTKRTSILAPSNLKLVFRRAACCSGGNKEQLSREITTHEGFWRRK